MLKRLIILLVLCTPVATWAFIKPIRVIAPELAGLTCIKHTLCTDDVTRSQDASRLYDEALHFVDSTVGTIEHKPRVIFCSSKACFQSFGLGQRSAATIGTFGIVISPRAWKHFYVRHEMIHHLENEKLGLYQAWREPKWFMEGMAYSLSGDPRPQLSEPYELYRSQFEYWYKQVGKKRLWSEAREL